MPADPIVPFPFLPVDPNLTQVDRLVVDIAQAPDQESNHHLTTVGISLDYLPSQSILVAGQNRGSASTRARLCRTGLARIKSILTQQTADLGPSLEFSGPGTAGTFRH